MGEYEVLKRWLFINGRGGGGGGGGPSIVSQVFGRHSHFLLSLYDSSAVIVIQSLGSLANQTTILPALNLTSSFSGGPGIDTASPNMEQTLLSRYTVRSKILPHFQIYKLYTLYRNYPISITCSHDKLAICLNL